MQQTRSFCKKNCLNKEKAEKLLEQAHIHVEDTPFSNVESLYTLDDEYFPQAIMVLRYSTMKEDSGSSISDASDPKIQTIYTSQPLQLP